MYFLELQYALSDCISDWYNELKYCMTRVINFRGKKKKNKQEVNILLLNVAICHSQNKLEVMSILLLLTRLQRKEQSKGYLEKCFLRKYSTGFNILMLLFLWSDL